MEGETSQNIVSGGIFDGEPDISFDEDTTEGTETPKAAEPETPKAEKQEGAAEDLADFLTVRYNKADRKLSKAEAVEYAQKGLNYDHVSNELKSYREGPIGRAMKAYADEAGMSVEAYAEMMLSNQEAAAERTAMDKLQEQYPDAPEELLKELVKAQRAEAKGQAKTAEEAKRQKAWADALSYYPDIKPDNLPQDVQDAVANGSTPLDALRMHELTALRAKVAELTSAQEAKQKQDDNRARSIGSAAGVTSSGEAEDDFLAGMSMRSRGY